MRDAAYVARYLIGLLLFALFLLAGCDVASRVAEALTKPPA